MRKPLTGLPLRLRDLGGAHFLRKLRPISLCLADAPHGREIEPLMGGDVVDAYAAASGIGQTEVKEGIDATSERVCLELVQRITINVCHVSTVPCTMTGVPAR